MTVITTTNANITFTVNTAWLTPEHNEAVMALNDARVAALAELDDAYTSAYDDLDEQIDRLKAKQKVLDGELAEARRVIDEEHEAAVRGARGQQEETTP